MKNYFSFSYNFHNKKIDVKKNLPTTKEIFFLRSDKFFLQRDMFNIASSVFMLEKILKKNRQIYKVSINISEKTYKKVNVGFIESNIKDLFLKILLVDVGVKLIPKKLEFSKTRKKFKFKKSNAICLFSGGVDSFSGLLNVKKKIKKIVPLYIAHSDQKGMISIINKINQEFSLDIETLHAPPITKGGYSQLRGFLYFMLAGLYASLVNTKKIIITECGPTMYQPRFSPMDEITYTTHPDVLKITKNILESFIGKVDIMIPFEDMTKAEVIAASPIKTKFDKTHSCITQRKREHDGTCYGCVIRKLGVLVVGVKDVDYNYDILSEDDNPKKSDNPVSLLNMCYDILFDYNRLLDSTKESIEKYGKQKLFERFALDNFSALYIYYEVLKNKKSKFIKDLYEKTLSNLGEEIFKKHIEEVRSNKIKPHFEKFVK